MKDIGRLGISVAWEYRWITASVRHLWLPSPGQIIRIDNRKTQPYALTLGIKLASANASAEIIRHQNLVLRNVGGLGISVAWGYRWLGDIGGLGISVAWGMSVDWGYRWITASVRHLWLPSPGQIIRIDNRKTQPYALTLLAEAALEFCQSLDHRGHLDWILQE